jgi:CheY-like chemotaxis protein
MLQAGNLKKLGLAKLLEAIEQERKSGTLFIRGPKGIGSISFNQGLIVQAESPIMPRRIGRILVESGVLTQKQLQQALKAQEEGEKKSPLGEILIRLGFVDPSKLREIIRLQVADSVHTMLDWREGVFRFEEQEVFPSSDLLLSPQEVIAHSPTWTRKQTPDQEVSGAEEPPEVVSTGLMTMDRADQVKEEIDSMISRVTERLKSMEPKQAVVLVEDETLLRTIFKDKLEDFGFNVRAVDSAQAAIEELERLDTEGYYSVVVTDLVLPTISGKGVLGGLELVEHLRNNYPHIPLIMTTAYPDVNLRRKALFMGVSHYLYKPDPRQISLGELESQMSLFIEELSFYIDNLFQRREISFEKEHLGIIREELVSELLQAKMELKEVGKEVERDAWDLSFLRNTSDLILKDRKISNVADTMLDFASKNLDRAALFFVKKEDISGYRAVDRTAKEDGLASRILKIRFAPQQVGLFRGVISEKQAYWGKPPDDPDANLFFRELGNFRPKQVIAIPIIVQQTVVAILYGDVGPASPPCRNIDALMILANLASFALEISRLTSLLQQKDRPDRPRSTEAARGTAPS